MLKTRKLGSETRSDTTLPRPHHDDESSGVRLSYKSIPKRVGMAECGIVVAAVAWHNWTFFTFNGISQESYRPRHAGLIISLYSRLPWCPFGRWNRWTDSWLRWKFWRRRERPSWNWWHCGRTRGCQWPLRILCNRLNKISVHGKKISLREWVELFG